MQRAVEIICSCNIEYKCKTCNRFAFVAFQTIEQNHIMFQGVTAGIALWHKCDCKSNYSKSIPSNIVNID